MTCCEVESKNGVNLRFARFAQFYLLHYRFCLETIYLKWSDSKYLFLNPYEFCIFNFFLYILKAQTWIACIRNRTLNSLLLSILHVWYLISVMCAAVICFIFRLNRQTCLIVESFHNFTFSNTHISKQSSSNCDLWGRLAFRSYKFTDETHLLEKLKIPQLV